nr:hypothetical protein [Austwickia chelonae]
MTNFWSIVPPYVQHDRDVIEVRLTVVVTALAMARYLQQRTGLSIKKIVRTLRPPTRCDHPHRRDRSHRRSCHHPRSTSNPRRRDPLNLCKSGGLPR